MTIELADLLRRAAEPIAERDFVDVALAGARARRRRGRWATLAAAAAAAAVIASIAIPGVSRKDAAVPASTPTMWSSSPFALRDVEAMEGPAPIQMSMVPSAPDDLRKRLQLSPKRDFNAITPVSPL